MVDVVDDGCCGRVDIFLAELGGIVVTEDDEEELFLFSFNFSWISCKLVFDESCERIIPNGVEEQEQMKRTVIRNRWDKTRFSVVDWGYYLN